MPKHLIYSQVAPPGASLPVSLAPPWPWYGFRRRLLRRYGLISGFHATGWSDDKLTSLAVFVVVAVIVPLDELPVDCVALDHDLGVFVTALRRAARSTRDECYEEARDRGQLHLVQAASLR